MEKVDDNQLRNYAESDVWDSPWASMATELLVARAVVEHTREATTDCRKCDKLMAAYDAPFATPVLPADPTPEELPPTLERAQTIGRRYCLKAGMVDTIREALDEAEQAAVARARRAD